MYTELNPATGLYDLYNSRDQYVGSYTQDELDEVLAECEDD